MSEDELPMTDGTRALPHWSSSGAYLLFVLGLVSMHQFAGQYLFSVALEPIKAEFHLSDSQLGAINGPAFLVFFGLAGIPIAHLAERLGRRQVITASVAAWSALTAVTALATGFFAFFVTRALVGIAQSGCNPAVQSLIAARFPPQQRSGAMAVLYAGLFLGVLLGLALGSALVQVLGWRGTFFVAGVSGIVLVPLVWFTLRDPPLSAVSVGDTVLGNVTAVVRSRGILHYIAMNTLMNLITVATFTWAPAFYTRNYGMNAAEAGAFAGFILGGGSCVAGLVGGVIVNRLERAREDAGSSFMLWCTFAALPAGVGAFLVNNRAASLTLLFLWTFSGCLPAGRIFAMLHDLVEPRQRAVAVALTFLAASVIGGIGPFLVGVVSDVVGPGVREPLRVGLMSINALGLWVLFHMYALVLTCRRHRRDSSACATCDVGES